MESQEIKYKNKCCVPGCKNKASKRHNFPNPRQDEDMCKRWIESIKSPQLEGLTPQQIYRTFYVCDKHFAQEYLVPGTKRGLRKDAIPTLHLSFLSEEVEAIGTLQSLYEHQVSLQSSQSESTSHLPSTSRDPLEDTEPQYKSMLECHGEHGKHDEIAPGVCKIAKKIAEEEKLVSNVQSGSRKRKGILQQVDVTRQNELTPRCKKFYHVLGTWGRKTASLQFKIKSLKQRLANAEKVGECGNLIGLLNVVNDATYTFIMQQVRVQQQRPRARRFTLDEKILSLTLLKSSAKAYRLLSKIFCLPSTRTLTNLLNAIPYGPGINKQIFTSLKITVQNLKNKNDRLCAVVFDEISIRPLLSYNKKQDEIQGVEDFGNNTRTTHIANHANVFMLKGIHRQWKQALAFTFSSGPMKSKDLKIMIQNVIKECQQSGLEVVATVCDQGGANTAAINALLRETNEECLKSGITNTYSGFAINGKNIIPLYDVPHLFKGLRNNLLTKDLHFEENGKKKIARWEHIEKFYKLDKLEDVRMCPKLTDGHILEAKMNKMKVSAMTQVFSHTVGSLMKRILKFDTNTEYDLPPETEDTADFILLMDRLFDSLNGNTKKAPATKPLKGGISKNSGHEDFWRNSISTLETMRFYSVQKKRVVKVPSAINLVKTIKGFIYLKHQLLTRITYILPRAVNQDCLENFFASLRGHARYNMTPDVAHFITSFKALIVNNFVSRHSPGANCEKDFSVGALDNLRCFITGEDIAGVSPLFVHVDTPVPNLPTHHKKRRVAKATIAYIAGFIAKKLLKITDNCQKCQELLFHNDGDVPLEIIEGKEYPTAHLIRPGSFLYFSCSEALTRLFYLIPRLCNEQKLSLHLYAMISRHINITVLKCTVHNDLGKQMLKSVITTTIFFWVRQVSLVLRGKDEKFRMFLKTKPLLMLIDPVKLEAHNIYLKRRNKPKKPT